MNEQTPFEKRRKVLPGRLHVQELITNITTISITIVIIMFRNSGLLQTIGRCPLADSPQLISLQLLLGRELNLDAQSNVD